MKEKLIIRNFGPIKDVELELRRFNILIGEQATGKSTVAKLLAVCRYFSYIIKNPSPVKFEYGNFFTGLEAWGLNEALNENSYIFYENRHYTFKVEKNYHFHQWQDEGDEVHDDVEPYWSTHLTPISSEFKNLLSELDKIRPESNGRLISTKTLSWIIPASFFQNDVAVVMDNPFYLPSERGLQSIFSLGKSSIQNLSDALFNQFAKMDGIVRLFTTETSIEPVKIFYKNENGKGYVRKINEESFYSLFNAATGFQSIIPIVLTAKYYGQLRKKTKTLIVEEPELNLFPLAQNNLVRFLVASCANDGNPIFLTTHSPYILTSINNLLYSFKVGREHSKRTNEITNEQFWLNPDDVSAYMMLATGKCENIVDKEGLIKAEKIDSVSRILNEEFDSLMNIELNEK